MFKQTTLIVLIVTLAACGSAAQQKARTKAFSRYVNDKSHSASDATSGKDSQADSSTTGQQPISAPASSPQAAPIAQAQTTTASTATCTSGSTQQPGAVDTIIGAVYVSKLVTWKDAMNKAPAGHRLATRGEVLILFDSGALKQINFSLPAVWTASETGVTDAWVVEIMDGSLSQNGKGNQLPAIYVEVVQ